MLGAHVFIAALLGQLLRGVDHRIGLLAELGCGHGRPTRTGQRVDRGPDLGRQCCAVRAHGVEQGTRDALALLEQGVEDVQRLHLGIALGRGDPHRSAQGVLGLGGELDVHRSLSVFRG